MAILLLQNGFMICNPETISLAYEAKLKPPMSSGHPFLTVEQFLILKQSNMKTIKSLSILTVLAIAGLSSCSKDTATDPLLVDNSFVQPTALAGTTALADKTVTTTTLPQVVLDYVTENHPNTTIAKSEIENNGNFEVTLSDGMELIFGADGAFLGIDDDTNSDFGDTVVDPSALPQTITDYVATNHTGLTITIAAMENNGHYEVNLSDGSTLVFDGNGAFLGIGVEDGDGNDDGGTETENDGQGGNDSNDGTVIDAATLPQAAKDYLAANYTGQTITKAEKENNGNYEVTLNNGVEVYFDSAGAFLNTDNGENGGEGQNGDQHEDGTVIDAATLPQLVKDYLSTAYPDATIVEARSMADGGFEVELNTGIEVIFDANGSFVKTENVGSEDGD